MLVFSSPGDQGRGGQTLGILTAPSLVSAAGSSMRPGCWGVALSQCYWGWCRASQPHPNPASQCLQEAEGPSLLQAMSLSDKSLIWGIWGWEFLRILGDFLYHTLLCILSEVLFLK